MRMRWRKRENAYEMEEQRELVKQRMRKRHDVFHEFFVIFTIIC